MKIAQKQTAVSIPGSKDVYLTVQMRYGTALHFSFLLYVEFCSAFSVIPLTAMPNQERAISRSSNQR